MRIKSKIEIYSEITCKNYFSYWKCPKSQHCQMYKNALSGLMWDDGGSITGKIVIFEHFLKQLIKRFIKIKLERCLLKVHTEGD